MSNSKIEKIKYKSFVEEKLKLENEDKISEEYFLVLATNRMAMSELNFQSVKEYLPNFSSEKRKIKKNIAIMNRIVSENSKKRYLKELFAGFNNLKK